MSQTPTIDPRQRAYVTPTRIVWQSDGVSAPHNSETLLADSSGQAVLNPRNVCTFTHAGEMPGLLMDFGRELHGGVQIVVGKTKPHPAKVRIRFGESAEEAMGAPNNDHANHDITFPLPQYGTQEVGNTGFRFVRIDLIEEGEMPLIAVRAVTLMRPLEYIGEFQCNDQRLNDIWQVGARTVHLCMQDYVWDGIKRDRLVWIGDMHPETQVISAVFGAHEIVPQSLDFVRDTTPLPGWMNGISSYSLWWVIIQHDWYRHGGDMTYLAAQRSYLLELLALMRTQVGDDSSETLGEWRFLDWPTVGNLSALHAGLHALLIIALDAGKDLCHALGETTAMDACQASSQRLREHAPALITGSKQSASLLALAGVYGAAEVNKGILAAEPLSGISSFYGYYTLQARAMAGDFAGCLHLIRTYWGAMLDLGATSFWEDFDLRWAENAGRIDELTPPGKIDIHTTYGDHCYKSLRHSLCHGWAAGPTAWLSEHVLGVQIVEPGCKVVRITPHLGDLTDVKGVFPTPYGPLSIHHRLGDDGTVQTTYDAPAGVQVLTDKEVASL